MLESITFTLVLQKTFMICLYAVPMCYVYTCFSFVFWGYSITGLRRYIFGYAVVQTVLGTFEITFMPLFLHQFYFFITFMLLFMLFFRRKKYSIRLIVPLFAYFVYFFMENVIASFSFAFFSRSQSVGTFLIPALSLYPGIILMAWLTHRLIGRDSHPGQNILSFMQRNKKSSYTLIIFYVLQFFVVTLTGSISMNMADKKEPLIFSIIALCFFMSGVLILVALRAFYKSSNNEVASIQQSYIHDIERLFTSIRGQRHDFLNHIQVIHSMVSREKKAELRSYAEEVFVEIQEGNNIVNVGHPLFAAVLENKKTIARSLGIEFRFSFTGLDSLASDHSAIESANALESLLDDFFEHAASMGTKVYLHLSGEVEGDKLSINVDTNCQDYNSRNGQPFLFTTGKQKGTVH